MGSKVAFFEKNQISLLHSEKYQVSLPHPEKNQVSLALSKENSLKIEGDRPRSYEMNVKSEFMVEFQNQSKRKIKPVPSPSESL